MIQPRILSPGGMKRRQPHPDGVSRAAHWRVSAAGRRATARTTPRTEEASSPWRSVLGPESRLPNVYWGAMSTTSLRQMSYYTALPPAEEVLLECEAAYRYVRQDTTLWSSLHSGRLTTSRLKDALGLRDHTASRLVGGPQYPETGVLHAYQHLQQPLYVPQAGRGAVASSVGAGAAGPGSRASEAEALQLNEASRHRFNEAIKGSGAEEEPVGTAPGAAVPGGSGAGDSGGAHDGEGWSATDRRRVSELAALSAGAAGAVRLRLLWGSLQEAAAVATLSALFPTSQLEEVGLLCLPDPSPWGVERSELPPLGASPDALITHNVPITLGDIQAGRRELQHSVGSAASSAAAPPPDLHRTATAIARSLLRAALARHTQLAASGAGGTFGIRDSSNSSSNSSSTNSSSSSTSNRNADIGSCSGGAGGNGGAGDRNSAAFRCRTPPLFASGSEEAVAWLVTELLRPDSLQASPGLRPMGQSGVGSAEDDVAAVVQLREVVEVKNHCPFVYKGQRKARKRGIVLEYVVRERGPIESLWALWVPQLQAHMACSGADSALLLSRSASKGVRLFRMFRDDGYLEVALDMLRELQCAHVARRQPPGSDPWVGRPGYEDFLQRTLAIARGSETVISTSKTPQLPGTDADAFWKLR